jgi:hypothetical protein
LEWRVHRAPRRQSGDERGSGRDADSGC